MTGFIRGLFGGGDDRKPQKPSGAFYLDPDEAKTLGDIDFMRQSKLIKRTYAKKQGEVEEKESVSQVSSLSKSEVEETKGYSTPSSTTTPTFSQSSGSGFTGSSSSTESSQVRRRSDTGMDMFRKMAKDVKKR